MEKHLRKKSTGYTPQILHICLRALDFPGAVGRILAITETNLHVSAVVGCGLFTRLGNHLNGQALTIIILQLLHTGSLTIVHVVITFGPHSHHSQVQGWAPSLCPRLLGTAFVQVFLCFCHPPHVMLCIEGRSHLLQRKQEQKFHM